MQTRQTVLYSIFAVLIALTFTVCGNGNDNENSNGNGPNTGGEGGNPPAGNTVPGNTLAEKLAWLSSHAASDTTYTVTVNENETLSPQTLFYENRSNVTINLWGRGRERTIYLWESGNLFDVQDGVKLVLNENITLRGMSNNNRPVNPDDVDNGSFQLYSVVFLRGGELEMRAGSKITGNAGFSGGGVHVGHGTFTMNGGEISGNNYGVSTWGIFAMNGGKITNNGAYTYGGSGVEVLEGTFTMTGGEISGNTGGGVSVGYYSSGGAVFRIVNGIIYGSNEGNLSNTSTSLQYCAAALYKYNNGTAQRGTFSGETWVSKGDLSSTDNTIRVVNGELR
jgi:hypothetical protein